MNTLTAKFGIANAGIRVAALAALLIGAGSAHALLPPDTRTEVVHYGDLNVNTDKGARQLYVRLNRAAELVCGDPGDPMDSFLFYRDCEREAIGAAIQQAPFPKLTALAGRHFVNRGEHVANPARGAPGIVLRG